MMFKDLTSEHWASKAIEELANEGIRIELGDWDSPDNYREVPIEEYEKMLEADAEVT